MSVRRRLRRSARGEVPVRLIVLGLVGIGLLVVPLWFMKKERRAKGEKAAAIERAAAAPAPAASLPEAAAPPAANPDRFGLTFGWQTPSSPERLHAACHGEPRELANPHRGSCNPYAGDTSCRTEAPVLCVREQAPGTLALATTRSVVGFTLASRADADGRCAAELGGGWRMASFHDGGGWEIQGLRVEAFGAPTHRRVWVAIGDQRGNCWDAGP